MRIITLTFLVIVWKSSFCQEDWKPLIEKELPAVLQKHREFVSLPNVAANVEDILTNYRWAQQQFEDLGFNVELLEGNDVPIFFAEKSTNQSDKTILFYLHIDGQPADPDKWDQPDPFIPVLKKPLKDGEF
ncbi:MAG: acetylornithine deacetylase, partial [Bacteroidota bacterium]